MTKKTIIKKLPTVDNTMPKKRGRKPKVKPELIGEALAHEPETKTAQVKVKEVKKRGRKPKKAQETKEVKKALDIQKRQDDEMAELEKEALRIRSQLANELTLKKAKVAQVKYRTKYMELEHQRQQWNTTKANLLNIISQLRELAIYYAPSDEVFAVAEKITDITSVSKAGKTKALKMPAE